MWDFVGRTLAMLYALDSSLPQTPHQKEQWAEVTSRAFYARTLILDEGGKLDMMVNIGSTDGSVQTADFGDEVKQAARKLME